VAVSPDVGSLIHHIFGCRDLLQRSVVRNVAPSASSVILTTGTVTTPSRRWEALARPPRLRPGLLITFHAALAYLEVTLSTRSKQTREERAEASFQKKQEQARDGGQARAEYEAAARAVLKKTARLRALRLAKEATEAAAKIDSKPLTAAKKGSFCVTVAETQCKRRHCA